MRMFIKNQCHHLAISKGNDYNLVIMINEKIPDPKEVEREIGDFLKKKFGDSIKILAPKVKADKIEVSKENEIKPPKNKINFDLKPEELVSYLDQYIVKQDKAKSIISTKICTHFNRIKYFESTDSSHFETVGSIKSNVLLAGPTGVGKTYMVKLIAKKIGVPFVKGDATKFSETGYVGGDVEDLIRDLVREADDDIELAQYGIVYIDEIDKIASSRNLVGADVSRTGVQRALLKPMEDTDVELKVPHDPVSMMQEMEKYQKTGKREKRIVNTSNILFIVSGAFNGISDIIEKRTHTQKIGFSAKNKRPDKKFAILSEMTTEDLIEFGFESEFVGRLPIRSIFEELNEDDLYEILKSPNNPLILGKKLDFASYGIDLKFDDRALYLLALSASKENTGARGLVSAIEQALIIFESRLPSTDIKKLSVTEDVINDPDETLKNLLNQSNKKKWDDIHTKLMAEEKKYIKKYIESNWKSLSVKHKLTLSQYRIDHVADYYCKSISNIGSAIEKIRFFYDEIKRLELTFFSKHDVNIILEEDAIDYVIGIFINSEITFEEMSEQLTENFELGLKYIQERTGTNRFFLSRKTLLDPDTYFKDLYRTELDITNLPKATE